MKRWSDIDKIWSKLEGLLSRVVPKIKVLSQRKDFLKMLLRLRFKIFISRFQNFRIEGLDLLIMDILANALDVCISIFPGFCNSISPEP